MTKITQSFLKRIFGKKIIIRKKIYKKPPQITALERERARVVVHRRLEYFNQHYNFIYNRVAIRNQKTRWGSCSNKNNLNFSARILTLPEAVQDYLIVHELCHLKEFNHSQDFWNLVAETIPDYKKLRQILCFPERFSQ